jgi:alkylation response protein AidB-like acyl-CoA dehydrogenase
MDLSEDERVFVSAASGFVEKELRPAIAPFVREHRFPAPLVRTFAQAGFMGTSYDPACSARQRSCSWSRH